MNQIFDLSVPKGEIALALLNTYSTLVIRTDFTTAVFDPVGIKSYEEERIDLIIITHEHIDHFDHDLVIKLQERNNALVLTTPFLAQKLKELEKYVIPLHVGDSFKFNDIMLYAEYSNHTANQPLSFIFSTNIVNIYHPNDSRLFPEMYSIRSKYRPHLMVYTGNAIGEMPDMVKMIKPKVIVSYSDLRLKGMKISGVEIKMLKHEEVYRYSAL